LETANKLAVLQKMKREKMCSLWDTLEWSHKTKEMRGVTELAESLELAVTVLSRHTVVKLAKQDIGE